MPQMFPMSWLLIYVVVIIMLVLVSLVSSFDLNLDLVSKKSMLIGKSINYGWLW